MNYQDIKLWLKGALKSFTIWFNTTGFLLLEYLVANVENYEQYISQKTIFTILIIGNLLLRVKTNNSLKDK